MSLGKHGFSQHLEFPKGPYKADYVQFVVELFLSLLEQEVTLDRLLSSTIRSTPDAEALKKVLEDISKRVVEPRAVNEGKEEALDVDLVNLGLVLEVLLQGMLGFLDLLEPVSDGHGR